MANIWSVCFIPATMLCALQKSTRVYAFHSMYLLLSLSPSEEKETERNKNVSLMGDAASSSSQRVLAPRETYLRRLDTIPLALAKFKRLAENRVWFLRCK